MRFSDRYGYTRPEDVIQRERISDELRNLIWDTVEELFEHDLDHTEQMDRNPHARDLFRKLWRSYFKKPQDTLSWSREANLRTLRDWFFKASWWQIFNFLEICFVAATKVWSAGRQFEEAINLTLKSENGAYRMIDGKIIETIDEVAIESVTAAAKESPTQIKHHISTALSLLADRTSDQSRNVIKEAICAVEAAARSVSGKEKATLADALKALRGDAVLHPSLAQAFEKLYGFTNDAEGIRHALLDEPNVDKADAWFFLVVCSAFVSLLQSRRAGATRQPHKKS